MTRPLRLEFPGALYHVTSRGDRRKSIFFDDDDRRKWLDIVTLVCTRFNFVIHAYCQMTNHYHLMVETVDGNLAQGMGQLNSLYSQEFNRRHRLVGHVFQGRYKAILVQKETYLLELARYIVLNPVRAGMVGTAEEWPWSSQAIVTGDREEPTWFDSNWLRSQFGVSRDRAIEAYRQFVLDGIGETSPLKYTQHQMVLGDEAFVAGQSERLRSVDLVAVTKVQRRLSAMTLEQYKQAYVCRDEAMARAYSSTAFTMAEIGKYFDVGGKTVSRAVRRFESDAKHWVDVS